MRWGGARLTFCVRQHSALGTPLEWPEAKKNANHVRDWGIKVCISSDSGVGGVAVAVADVRVCVCVAITGDME